MISRCVLAQDGAKYVFTTLKHLFLKSGLKDGVTSMQVFESRAQ